MSPPPPLADLSDEDLVALARQRRDDAHCELVRRYQGPVQVCLYHLVHNREDAEDLTQETFARAFRAIEHHPPDRKFSAWIFKIANNAGLDHLRRKRLDTVPLENTPDVTPSGKIRPNAIQLANRALSTPTPPPRFRVRARAHAAEIEWAVQQLRKEQRVCVMLRFAEGRSYDDIADILECQSHS